MLRAKTAAAFVLIVLLVAGGCASPTPAELESAGSARHRVVEMLDGFSAAIRNKDARAAMAFVDPEAVPARKALFKAALDEAVWMARYTGYRTEAEQAASSLSPRALARGRAEMKVWASNTAGERFREKHPLVCRAGEWFLADVPLRRPVRGEPLDPPPEEAEKIRRVLRPVVESLKGGRPEEVMAALPAERSAYYRRAGRRATRAGSQQRSIYDDLRTMGEFEVLNWPDPESDLPLAFVGLAAVVVCYDIPYSWPEGGIYEADNLRMEIFFVRKRGRWELHLLRLYGKGIPGSR